MAGHSKLCLLVLLAGLAGTLSRPASPAAPAAEAAELGGVIASPYALGGGQAARIPVRELHLEMESLDAEVLFRKDPNDRSSFPVALVDGGRRHGGTVAVKGSFSRNFLKKSLLVNLPAGEEWRGRRRLALNAMATDPSQAREWLMWDLARRLGMLVPAVEYLRLYINKEYIGLYLDIEWMDQAMFRRLGLPAGGDFLQPEDATYCGDLTRQSLQAGRECWLKIATDATATPTFEAMVEELNSVPAAQFDAWLEKNFDSQSVIDWLLINALTQNGDTYSKNYFLYRGGPGKKWQVIPWDYDLAWGRVADPALSFPRMIFNDYFQYAYPITLGADNPLKDKTLANPKLYQRFQARLREVLDESAGSAADHRGWYVPARFVRQLADLQALVTDNVAQEKYTPATQDKVLEHYEALAFLNTWRFHYLKGQVLDPSPFDTLRWTPLQAYEPLTPLTPEQQLQRRQRPLSLSAGRLLGERGHDQALVESLIGWPLAMVTVVEGNTPLALSVESERETPPRAVPPDTERSRCIERSWYVVAKSASWAKVDLQLDYLQESSTRHELGAGVSREGALQLWQFDGRNWFRVPGRVNPLANLVVLPGVVLRPYVANLFVACQAL